MTDIMFVPNHKYTKSRSKKAAYINVICNYTSPTQDDVESDDKKLCEIKSPPAIIEDLNNDIRASDAIDINRAETYKMYSSHNDDMVHATMNELMREMNNPEKSRKVLTYDPKSVLPDECPKSVHISKIPHKQKAKIEREYGKIPKGLELDWCAISSLIFSRAEIMPKRAYDLTEKELIFIIERNKKYEMYLDLIIKADFVNAYKMYYEDMLESKTETMIRESSKPILISICTRNAVKIAKYVCSQGSGWSFMIHNYSALLNNKIIRNYVLCFGDLDYHIIEKEREYIRNYVQNTLTSIYSDNDPKVQLILDIMNNQKIRKLYTEDELYSILLNLPMGG